MTHAPRRPASARPPSEVPIRKVDALDRRIIGFLQRDGRMTNTEMARQLRVTETTVRKRVGALLEEGLLTVVGVPDPAVAGLTLSAIIGIRVHLKALRQVSGRLRTWPEVRYVGLATGRYDIIIEAFFTDQEHVLEFVTAKLGVLEGVVAVESSLILKVEKFSYEWEIDDGSEPESITES
jgi:Lrp/AsnC family transcriptional regulator, regulator for asnA, asnC and gidA